MSSPEWNTGYQAGVSASRRVIVDTMEEIRRTRTVVVGPAHTIAVDFNDLRRLRDAVGALRDFRAHPPKVCKYNDPGCPECFPEEVPDAE